MAKIKPGEIFAHIDNDCLMPAYLLSGEEGYLIDRSLSRLVQKALAGGPPDFNLDVFYAKDTTADAVAAQANTFPMMAERRVVVLKEANRLKDVAPLKAYMESPSPATVLILVAEGAERAKEESIARAMGDSCAHVHFYHPMKAELTRWIKVLTKESGYAIDDDATGYMLDVLGENLALIEAELNKVFNFTGEGKTVTYEDVKEAVGDFGLPLVFDLADAVADKGVGSAMDMLGKLLMEGEQPVMILGMMSAHWRKLLDAKERTERGEGPKELRSAFRLNFKNEKKFLGQVSRLPKEELVRAFHLFRKADTALKGSALSPKLVMERLVFELAGVYA